MTHPPAFPPFRMKKDVAAYYCGLSLTSFDRAVEAGEIPPGTKRTGGTFWLREDLERSMVERNTASRPNFATPI